MSFKQEDGLETNEKDDLLLSYKAISQAEVRKEIDALKAVTALSWQEWQDEVSVYQTRTVKCPLTESLLPTRNYPNEKGTVDNPALYPYHTACYPLLDAYDWVDDEWKLVNEFNDSIVRTTELPYPHHQDMPDLIDRLGNNGLDDVDNRTNLDELRCSFRAIETSIGGVGPLSLMSQRINGHYIHEEWENGIMYRKHLLSPNVDKGVFLHQFCIHKADDKFAEEHGFGLAALPSEPDARADILLKLLRHSLSDLQRDHILARAVLLRMCDWKLFQDVTIFRKTLSIIGTGAKCCDGHCLLDFWQDDELEDPPDHSCARWKRFERAICMIVFKGIDYFTCEHALALSGAAQLFFDVLNPTKAAQEASLLDNARQQSVEDRQRTKLKLKLFKVHNSPGEDDDSSEEEDDDEEPQAEWMDQFVVGCGWHAVMARRRIIELQKLLTQNDEVPDAAVLALVLRKSIDSFYNCMRCLVHIGETAVRRLPCDNRAEEFGSALVRALAHMFLEPTLDYFDKCLDEPHDRAVYFCGGRPVIDPNRYADTITNATALYKERQSPASTECPDTMDKSVKESIEMADLLLNEPPGTDVRDLIHCLFAKDMVDVVTAGCGYGDIQVWWGLPVTPLDPLLFLNGCNHPPDESEDSDEEEEDEEEERERTWLIDEDGFGLRDGKLEARYDLSLMLLLRAWHRPWKEESHFSFQKPFRDAVKSLFLSSYRVGVPKEIAEHVASFMHRDWWPDERAQCWNEDCLAKRATKLLTHKLLHRGESPRSRQTLSFCPSCRVATYCCEKHRKEDYFDGHKSLCCRPPYRVPGRLEEKLCAQISALPGNKVSISFTEESMGEAHDDEDDNGSWESIDSSDDDDEEEDDDELQQHSVTRVVYQFFYKHTYKFYDEDDDEDDDDGGDDSVEY